MRGQTVGIFSDFTFRRKVISSNGLSENSQVIGSHKTLSIMLSQWSINMMHGNLEMVLSIV